MMQTSRTHENAAKFQELSEEGVLPGPISLSVDMALPLMLPPIEWKNWNNTGQLKITNIGYTTVITGHWKRNRPSLFGGPLTSPYSLGQIHFHWGPDDKQGSEHTIEDKRYPLEMHVLFYKKSYQRSKIALKERDGITVLAYVFEIKDYPNRKLDPILDGVASIREANKQAPLSPDSTNIVAQFVDQYFLYWGAVNTQHCSHTLSWIVCPTPQPISNSQLNIFRQTLGSDKKPIRKNFCDLQPHMGRSVYYATTEQIKESSPYRIEMLYPPISTMLQRKNTHIYCCLSARMKRLTENIIPASLATTVDELSANIDAMSSKLKELEKLCKEINIKPDWYKAIAERLHIVEITLEKKTNERRSNKECKLLKGAHAKKTNKMYILRKYASDADITTLSKTVHNGHRQWRKNAQSNEMDGKNTTNKFLTKGWNKNRGDTHFTPIMT